MNKLGTSYQELVAEVIKAFDPNNETTVEEGVWVAGPDGRRDIDVSVRGVLNGKPTLLLIECKDYGKGTGKVGIDLIDALDSKRHDLGADIAMISSNSGFTEPALRKARRTNITAVSVLKAGDERVKIEIRQEIYFRKVQLGDITITYNGPDTKSQLQDIGQHNVEYKGKPINAWLITRVSLIALMNPEFNNELITYTANFTDTGKLILNGKKLNIDSVSMSFKSVTRWYAQTVSLDASKGLYDYLRGRVRLAAGQHEYMIKGLNIYEGTEIDGNPMENVPRDEFIAGEIDVQLALVEGIPKEGLDTELAPLEEIIKPDDLEYFMKT